MPSIDELKQQVGMACSIENVPEFVENENFNTTVSLEFCLKLSVFGTAGEFI